MATFASLRLLACMPLLAVPLAVAANAADAVVVYEPAPAAEMPTSPFDISFLVTGTSDYRFRGISQTDGDPALQGTIEATYSILYAGAFVSNVDFGTSDPDIEVDVFAGIRPEFAGISFDLGVVGYLYPDATDLNFLEIYGGASYDFDVVEIGGSVYYSPDYANSDTEAVYLEATAAIPLPYDFSISGGIGHQFFEDGFGTDDYFTWNAGISYTLDDLVTFDVRYVDTDLNEDLFCTGPVRCGSTVMASVTVETSLSDLRTRFSR